ncbi:MAG: DNA-processing protein DprA [Candidatus Levybacteria bacterium]|nr:DNA-processing protein DprA [Candidatus Levybacteria bacterium]
MEERNYWLPFSVFPGIGPAKFKLLLKHFGSAKSAWEATKFDLAKLLGEKLTEKLADFRSKFSIAQYSNDLKKKNVWFLILTDKDYPQDLLKINNPPFVLYGKGNPSLLCSSWPSVAVVGARRTTQYGREVTKLLTTDLVLSGFTIVSGLAMGVDAVSHQAAVDNNGRTIAVLGCGVDCCTPSENRKLYNSILQGQGVIISELPLGEPPSRGSFPARNRIIAGLSLGVLVTEGAEDSGSLITAEFARKFNRKIFAVPGPITSSMSKGPYSLIKKGAKLVVSVSDILNELKFPISNSQFSNKSKNTKFKTAVKEEQVILDLLQNEAVHFDEIVRRLQLDSAKVGSLLSMMEIKGLIKSLDGGAYATCEA